MAFAVRDPAPPRGTLYPKLRPGPGRPTDQVVANQRARLTGAMVELVAERGYRGVTVRGLSRLAGVSTKTFYQCFENVEDCFAATHSRIVGRALRRARGVSSSPGQPLRKRIRAFFEALGEEPKAARLVLVDSFSSGPALIAMTHSSRRALGRFVDEELTAEAGSVALPPEIGSGVAAAGLHLMRSQLLFDASTSSSVIADEFVDWLLPLRSCGSVRGWREGIAAVAGAQSPPELIPAIADDQHFLLAAVTRLSLRDGYASLTVPAICREAGISRRSFDERFDGVAGCFLAAIEARITAAASYALSQAKDAGSWERALVRTVAILCVEFARDPVLGRLALVDVLAPGQSGLDLRQRMIIDWARRIRRTAPTGVRPSQMAAEASVAAAMGMAEVEATAGRPGRIGGAVPSLAFLILAPLIGSARAEQTIASELRTLRPEHEVRKHSTKTP